MKVSYRVTLDPRRKELRVQLLLSELAPGEATLLTPTWAPGDYDFDQFGRHVFDVRAVDPASGRHAEMHRHGWSCYSVEQRGEALTVSYRASAAPANPSIGTRQLSDIGGVLPGTRYLRVAAHDGPCLVHYDVPEGWAIHHPAGARAHGGNTWEYDNYEQLLDTPVSFGRYDLHTRSVRGAEFHHVFLKRTPGFEQGVQRFVDDLAKIADVYCGIFGSIPFESHTCVLSFNPGDNWDEEQPGSSVDGLDPATFSDAAAYKASLRVCARGLFHAWNVKRPRSRSTFSESLWVEEGFTRYYELLSCTRSGICTPEQFFRAIDHFDAGMVIAFELDAALRTETGGLQSLDTAFAKFYEAYAGLGLDYTIKELCAFFDARLDGLGKRRHDEAVEPARLHLLERLRQLGFAVTESAVPCLGVAGLAWQGTQAQAALIAQWLNAPFSPGQGLGLGMECDEDLRGAETAT